MPEPHWVDVLIDGQPVPFHQWPAGSDYEAVAADVEDLRILTCIDALEAHAAEHEKVIGRGKPVKVELSIELDRDKLFPWESNVFSIGIYQHDDEPYRADFSINTAIGVQPHALREAILAAISGTGFELYYIEATGEERPTFEEDGWHRWTCQVSAFPEHARFSDLFALRDRISQAVFLMQDVVSTPYLALRMVQLGQAQALLGARESEWLECKSAAYELKSVHEMLWKHELAEDVAQFANTEVGGLLLIGFRTKRKSGVDTIEKITPVPASDARAQTYRDVLRQRIHPPISRLLIEAYPWEAGQIICIYVPPQATENYPYLVAGSTINGRYIKAGITIVRREGDASIPITAQEIHATLAAGRALLRGNTS